MADNQTPALSDSNPIMKFLRTYLASRAVVTSAVLPLLVAVAPPLAPLIAANPELAVTIGGAIMAAVDMLGTYKTQRRARKPAPTKPAPKST